MTDAAANKNDKGFVRPKTVDNRATWRQHLQWRLEAAGWYGLYWNRFKAMDIETASRRGAKLVSWIGPRLGRSANRTATRNLALAFPELSQDERDAILRKSWENFGMIAGETPHAPEFRLDREDVRLEVVGGEILDHYRETGAPSVLFSGHLANWEVIPPAINKHLPDAELTYRYINNPHIDRCIASMRDEVAGGNHYSAKGIGTRNLMRALSKGRCVGLMNDQKFNEGVSVPFFGHNAMTAPGPTRLAMKYKCALTPFSVRRVGLARYRVTIHEPFMPESAGNDDENVYNTLLKINAFIEARIREAPEQWFWQHNRWPKEAWAAAGVM